VQRSIRHAACRYGDAVASLERLLRNVSEARIRVLVAENQLAAGTGTNPELARGSLNTWQLILECCLAQSEGRLACRRLASYITAPK
jgi:hypothetical protein